MNRYESCLSLWFPKIEAAGLPVPKTLWTRVEDWHEMVRIFDGEKPEVAASLAAKLVAFGDEIGWPCFLRTGQTSHKHRWSECCYFADRDKVMRHIAGLVEFSEIADFIGLPYDVWAIRELLPTRALFLCRGYCDFPVVREFRAFVDGERVVAINPYWPEEALEEGDPDKAGWRSDLDALHSLAGDDRDAVASLASRAGRAVGGRWSVDILDTERGWYVTDMATAETSWGYREAEYV